jgi:hypothetical protein
VSVNDVNARKIKQSNMNFFRDIVFVGPRLPCVVNMTNVVSSPAAVVNSETSDYVCLFNIAMYPFATKCFPMDLVPCSDGW